MTRDEPIRNDLCSGCGRWHDATGQMLMGWRDWHGVFWDLPPGHMPRENIDAEPVYGFCVMGAAPASSMRTTEGTP